MFTKKNNELALINDSMEYFAQVVSAPAILDRKKGIINPPPLAEQWWRYKGAKMCDFGIIEMGGVGMVQMFYLINVSCNPSCWEQKLFLCLLRQHNFLKTCFVFLKVKCNMF